MFVYWLSTHPMWRFYIGAENVITGKKSSDGRPYLVTLNYVCAVTPIPFTVRKIRTGYLHHLQGNRARRNMTEFYEMFRRKRRGTALLSAESSLRALAVANFVRNFLGASLPRLVAGCSRRPWIRDQGAKWTLLAANY